MKIFGKKEEFAIQYEFLSEKYESNDKNKMLGRVCFWVKSKDLFALTEDNPLQEYFYDLSIIMELFCDYLFYHITDDPFPANTKSNVGTEMMDEMSLVEGSDNDITKYLDVDWDNVDDELYDKVDLWNIHHGILTNRGGLFLPHAYFRKVDDQVEISWGNHFPYKSVKGDVCLKYKKGFDYVDIKLYKEVIVKFCIELINRFKENYPEKMKENYENLKKAINVKL